MKLSLRSDFAEDEIVYSLTLTREDLIALVAVNVDPYVEGCLSNRPATTEVVPISTMLGQLAKIAHEVERVKEVML